MGYNTKFVITLNASTRSTVRCDVCRCSLNPRTTGRGCVWATVFNGALMTQLKPNLFINIRCRVSSTSLYPQQPLPRALQANQVKSTFTDVNISLNWVWRDTELKVTLTHCSEVNKLKMSNLQKHLRMTEPNWDDSVPHSGEHSRQTGRVFSCRIIKNSVIKEH